MIANPIITLYNFNTNPLKNHRWIFFFNNRHGHVYIKLKWRWRGSRLYNTQLATFLDQCGKFDSVAGESPRLFSKNYPRGGDLRDTLWINSYVTINFPETLFVSFWINSYVTINFQRHFLKINFCSRDNLCDTLFQLSSLDFSELLSKINIVR